MIDFPRVRYGCDNAQPPTAASGGVRVKPRKLNLKDVRGRTLPVRAVSPPSVYLSEVHPRHLP